MTPHASGITQSDIARAAGVSRSLVSLALSGSPKVAEHTRVHVEQVARSLGYRANVSASALAKRRSTTVGIVLPNLRNAFFEKVARCLDDAAAAQGLSVFVAVGAENSERLERAIDSLLGVRVLGVILVSPWLSAQHLRDLGEEAPTVLVGQQCPGGKVDAVHLDETAAAEQVVAHVHAQGATSLAYIAPRIVDDASRSLREDALAAAAAAAGLSMTVWEGDGSGAGDTIRERLGDDSEGTGLLTPGRLALVAHNDMLAIDATAVLRGQFPRDDAATPLLVSYDDTYLASRSEFDLTSVKQPEAELAGRAIELLLSRAESAPDAPARDELVQPELVLRSSSQR